ncbi:MANSC domain-containing protein 1 [Apodemus speciosus]|uniref:MANSC domain-containing protein 1 n=1 Tax=Apodemus speciosus TaxID=105296 RepID=A0ABQ0EWF5_APOSI
MLFWGERLVSALVVISFLTPRLCAGQNCLTKSLEDVVIDIQSSISKGIRGNEPIHTATREDCIGACCSTQDIAGDKSCNLMIFDTRKKDRQPNCYLFFCPCEDACPLKPAKGLVSYWLIRDFPLTRANSSLQMITQEESLLLGHTSPGVSPEVARPAGHPKPTTGLLWRDLSSPKSTASEHLHEVIKVDEASTQLPEGKSHPQSVQLPSELKMAHLLPKTVMTPSTSVAAAPTPKPAILLATVSVAPKTSNKEATTAPLVTTGTSKPPAAPVSTGFPAVVTHQAALTAFSQGHTDILDTVPFQDTERGKSSAVDSLSTPESSFTNQAASWGDGRVSVGGASLNRGLKSQRGFSFEKWLLIGTLLFGVLFLVIGLVLLGRILVESLRRKRYSRLDYLINGIYVDI